MENTTQEIVVQPVNTEVVASTEIIQEPAQLVDQQAPAEPQEEVKAEEVKPEAVTQIVEEPVKIPETQQNIVVVRVIHQILFSRSKCFQHF
jgi:hypothetical protein